jgi:outer membrane protein
LRQYATRQPAARQTDQLRPLPKSSKSHSSQRRPPRQGEQNAVYSEGNEIMKKIILASVVAIAMAATSASAADLVVAKKGTIKLDVRATAVVPAEEGKVDQAPSLTVDINNSFVPTIGIEYYLTDAVSVEAIAGTANHKIKVNGLTAIGTANDDLAKIWHLPPTVTAKYHFDTKTAYVPYVGAGVSYVMFYSVKGQNGLSVDLKNKAGFALQAGVDVNTNTKMSYNFDVKKIYVETDARVNNGVYTATGVKVDPLVVSAGVGFKF